MKKLISLILALVLVMALAVSVSAQEIGTAADNTAAIIINNAAKGETYQVYKLFDAKVTGTAGGSIAYTGDIPTDLASYFTKDTAGNISVAADINKSDLFDDLKVWASSATAAATATSDGSVLKFQGLAYGYYVVTSTQSAAAVSVDSTNPNATIYDKNATAPSLVSKVANDKDLSFGDTVEYTVTFNSANFDGADTAAKRIVSYTIEDDLPAYLEDVTVTEIKVDDTVIDLQQFENKKITIAWAQDGVSLYKNGAVVTIKYTAKLTESAAIAGNGNKNTVTLTWTNEAGVTGNCGTKDDTIYTYAFVLKKVDQKGNALSGAKFQLPFYVDEAYNYAGTAAGDGLTNTVTTPADGVIVIKGVASGTYSVTETVAPTGYNKLTAPVSVPVTATTATTTDFTTFLDKDGNEVVEAANDGVTVTYENAELAADVVVVVNKTGSALPSTGGMGTTLFYVIGGLLMAGAAVMLISKKRMA